MAQRRLAAIMFSDITGYDSLLKEDEKKAFDARKKNQRIHRRLIKKFNGRWLKDMGGGILACFSSIIDAVTCALSIQKAISELNISVRIGIHQGEVIFEKKDVLGDGVNIASRIHSVAETNDIVISETVYNDIKNKEGLEVEFLGEHSLKGVSKAVGIYKVSNSDESLLDFSIDTGELVRPFSFGRTTIIIGLMVIAILGYALYYFLPKTDLPSEPEKSILVLPFENFLGTDTLDYLVAGLHDELNGTMGKISALRVLSSRTANTFKNTDKTIKQISSEVGVNNVIKPYILCTGDSLCLRVEVHSTDKEKQPWVKEYHKETSQILELFNTITKEVSDEIDVNLRPQEEMMLTESRRVDPDAYNAYLKGRQNLDIFSEASLQKAIENFNKAIEFDPNWAAPYAGIAEAGSYKNQYGWGSRSDNIIMIYKNLNKAQELEPNSFYFHYINAGIAVWTEHDWKKGEREFKKALELNPSHVRSRNFYSHLLMILRRTDEAVYQANKALELNPYLDPFTAGLYVIVMADAGLCQETISKVDSVFSRWPDHPFKIGSLIEVYICLGEYDKAFENWKLINYKYWVEQGIEENVENVFKEKGWIAFLEELIINHEKRLIEDDQYFVSGLAEKYVKVEKYEKAMDYYEIVYENNKYDPNLPYLSAKNIYDKMKDNPRYIALLEKMNLPVD